MVTVSVFILAALFGVVIGFAFGFAAGVAARRVIGFSGNAGENADADGIDEFLRY